MPDLASNAIVTWRYTRLAMLLLIVALGVSTVLERLHARCWQESISAYYFTPVHSVFVGTLVGIGVCLIVLRGHSDVEDALLNVAGIFAPLVALVPTTMPSSLCGSRDVGIDKTQTLIGNNVAALLVAGLVSLLLAYVLTRLGRDSSALPHLRRADRAGMGAVAAVLLVGAAAYGIARKGFLQNAHTVAAVLMFATVGVVIYLNGRSATSKYRVLYNAIAVGMGIAPLIFAVGLRKHLRVWNLLLESSEIALFGMFWAVQTRELWIPGLRGAAMPPSPSP